MNLITHTAAPNGAPMQAEGKPVHPAAAALPRVMYALKMDPDKKFGSMEEQIVMLSGAFAREGGLFLPLFLCDPSAANVTQFTERGVQAECLDARTFRWKTLQRLCHLIRQYRIDGVHWNFVHPYLNRYLWSLSVLCPQVKHWYTDHNSRSFPIARPSRGLKKLVQSTLLRRYTKVLCVSRYVQQCLEQQDVWRRLDCLRHFINTERFRPDENLRRDKRHEMGVGPNDVVILLAGYVIKEKGFDVVLRALPQLPSQMQVWLVGEGPEATTLRALAAELGLGERVRFLGMQRNVQPFFQAADVFACPSRWGEAAGLVNVEACAMGLPILASRIGGIPEYVSDGRTGFLFEPGSSDDFARMATRLADADVRRRMRVEARAWAVEQFSPEARLPDFLSFYRTT